MPFRGGETAKRRNGRAGVPPANKGRGLPGEEIFSCRFAAVFLCRFGAAGEEMFSCPFRGGETAKRRNGRAGAPPASKGRGRPGEGA